MIYSLYWTKCHMIDRINVKQRYLVLWQWIIFTLWLKRGKTTVCLDSGNKGGSEIKDLEFHPPTCRDKWALSRFSWGHPSWAIVLINVVGGEPMRLIPHQQKEKLLLLNYFCPSDGLHIKTAEQLESEYTGHMRCWLIPTLVSLHPWTKAPQPCDILPHGSAWGVAGFHNDFYNTIAWFI